MKPATVQVGAAMFKEIVNGLTDYAKCREQEQTERERVRAQLKAVTAMVEARKEILIRFMDHSFAERDRLYELAERVLTVATESGDVESARMALNFLATVYNKNPLEGVQDSISGGIKNYLE